MLMYKSYSMILHCPMFGPVRVACRTMMPLMAVGYFTGSTQPHQGALLIDAVQGVHQEWLALTVHCCSRVHQVYTIETLCSFAYTENVPTLLTLRSHLQGL
jgi:hypothetical protein